jgi:peptide/nickel transport system substrate-binding protein
MFKKMHYISSILLILIIVLSACAPKATPTAAPATAAPTTVAPATEVPPSPTPLSDVVVLVTPAGQNTTTFTRNFNPFASTSLFPTQNGIYEPLMINNRITGKIVPWLATGYQWSTDLLTLTFTLRQGVQWSDGTDFTSADVVYTFNLLKTTAGLSGQGGAAVASGGYIDSVTAPDANTVAFKFNKVYTPGLYDLFKQNIVPEHIWKDVADPVKFTNDNPIGTGPFTEVVSFQDQVYEVDRNPHYWQPGKPAIKGLRMPGFSGDDAAATMFVNGDTEWTGQFFANLDAAVLSKNPTALHCWWPTARGDALFMLNDTKKPFDDAVVRKAVSMALNRQQLAQVAGFEGSAPPSDVTGLSSAFAAWKVADPSTLGDWTTFNPDKANQMLDAAGYAKGANGFRTNKDGSPIKAELMNINGFGPVLAMDPTIKTELAAIGLNTTINNYDPNIAFGKWFTGDFDMSIYFGIDADTPYAYYRDIMSAQTFKPIGQPTGFGENLWRAVIPAADEQLTIFASTTDPAVQKAAAVKLQQIFADNAPVIPVTQSAETYCYNDSKVTGWANADNPFVLAMPIGSGSTGEQLIQMVALTPK